MTEVNVIDKKIPAERGIFVAKTDHFNIFSRHVPLIIFILTYTYQNIYSYNIFKLHENITQYISRIIKFKLLNYLNYFVKRIEDFHQQERKYKI